jgi:hypothetical protein
MKEFLNDEAWIIAICALLVSAAVVYIRFGWRGGKRIDQR